mmetsp:Transcript_84004/g.166838  ORF Transcript_84004/g.166838 Transcript_84004/m.166838 type:complete len:279 (+) Transcript_84004:77-913(+)
MAMIQLAAPGQGTADSTLVERVKALCRSDVTAKSQWCTWCDANVGGTKDPTRMDTDTLQQFFHEYESGTITALAAAMQAAHTASRPPPKALPEQHELAEVVKIGQRVSVSWKNAWVSFCKLRGNGVYDPLKHPKEFLQSYLEFLGNQGQNALQDPNNAIFAMTTPPQATMVPPLKRPKVAELGTVQQRHSGPQYPKIEPQEAIVHGVEAVNHGFEAWGTDNSEPNLAELTEEVKRLQRMDPFKKQQWSEFCDLNGGGVKDPMRHNLETLQAFMQQCTR